MKSKKMFKKRVIRVCKVSFAPAITANVLTYFNGKRIKRYPFKGKFARKKTSSYLCRPEGASS
jgi:hypothetical protein